MSHSSASAKRKAPKGLIALSSAAVVAIYSAGYQRTQTAAEELDAATERRPARPQTAPDTAASTSLAAATAAPTAPAPASSAAAAESAAPAPAAPIPAPAPRPVAEAAASVPEPAAPVRRAEPEATVAKAPVAAAAAPALTADAPAPVAPPVAAPVAAPAAPAAPAAVPVKYKDGTFHAWGRSRHGDVYAFVVVENGRIIHSGYDKCQTRWSCTLIDHLGPQVVQRQSAEVDYVSGATESGNAFYWGVFEALAKAKSDAPPSGEASPQP